MFIKNPYITKDKKKKNRGLGNELFTELIELLKNFSIYGGAAVAPSVPPTLGMLHIKI